MDPKRCHSEEHEGLLWAFSYTLEVALLALPCHYYPLFEYLDNIRMKVQVEEELKCSLLEEKTLTNEKAYKSNIHTNKSPAGRGMITDVGWPTLSGPKTHGLYSRTGPHLV